MNNFDTYILKAIATNAGATVKAMDSVSDLLRKWLVAAGGIWKACDTRNDMLRKIARRRSVTIFPGDSNVKLLQRMTGRTDKKSANECLAYIRLHP